MPAWTVPTASDTYLNWPTYLSEHFTSQAKMFDDGVTWTSLPSGTIRWNASNNRFEKWNGTTWENLSTSLTDTCKTAANLSDLTSAATARTNLGLGSIATKNSPLGLADGGTGGTDAESARAGLGCGSMATQSAHAVAITGGTLSGISALTMTTYSTLSMTGWGTISNVATITNGAGLTLQTTGGAYNIDLRTNSTSRFTVQTTGLMPGANNSYDIGANGNVIRTVYTDAVTTGKINNGSDIAFQINGTTYWVMGASGKDFRPNGNSTQDIGQSSYYWNNAYLTIVRTEALYNRSGNSAAIYLSAPNAPTGNILLYASANLDIYAGGSIKWYFGADGKLNPWNAAPDYSITYQWNTDRSLSSNNNLAELADVVATIIADLVNLGLFS